MEKNKMGILLKCTKYKEEHFIKLSEMLKDFSSATDEKK